ncbi:MAG TPA: class I SAM-dependent methyltransferase [Blastocatellia bacterium]|nr:class I SAM-dependent methyltransferase [Blastocatellia bacterium]
MKPEEQLRTEFNKWADAGRGEAMEEGHRAVTDIIINKKMNLQPDSRALDLGCGVGWATRLMAAKVPAGRAAGVDISDEMIKRASANPANPPNLQFKVSSGAHLPFDDNEFTHCLSIESLYYHPDIKATLSEVRRVLAPGGTAFLMVNLFKENPYTHGWVQHLVVPVHLLSGDQYCDLAKQAGFASCQSETIPDPTPVPESYAGKWYADAEAMRASHAIGSLLVTAKK